MLLLRRSNHVLAEICISRGGLTARWSIPNWSLDVPWPCAPRPWCWCTTISRNTQPSDTDRRLTSTLCEAGKHLDLPVLDHVIVAGKAFVSFADQGWLP